MQPTMWFETLHARRVALVLSLIPTILLAPVVFTGKALFWGTTSLQFFPWRWAAWDAMKAGHLPLWNPWLGMGAPLLANYQSALLYPPNWLFFLLGSVGGPGWAAWGFGVLVTLHLIWAAWGAARLARSLGQSEFGQVIAGLAYGLCAYLVGRSGFLSMNAAAAWLPWMLVLVRDIQTTADSGSDRKQFTKAVLWRMGILAICVSMQLLAGHAQIAWYSWLLCGVWAGFWGWQNAHSHFSAGEPAVRTASGAGRVFWSLVRLAAVIIFALHLAAAQLLPTAEYLANSQRADEVSYEFASTYSFWPWRLLTAVVPDLYGNPVRGDYWGYGNYWEDATYIGLLPLLLGVTFALGRLGAKSKRPGEENQYKGEKVELAESDSDQRAVVGLLTIVITVALFLALGKNTPLFPWLYRHIPTFDLFQGPTRWTLWIEIALALLAGYGADAWRRPEKRRLYWSRLAIAGAFAITLGAGFAWYLMGEISPTFLRGFALAGLWGVGSGMFNLLAPPQILEHTRGGPHRWTIWHWGVILFVSLDLLAAGRGLNPGVDRGFFTFSNPVAQNLRDSLGDQRLYLPEDAEYALKFERFMQFESFDPGEDWLNLRRTLLPNLSLLDGIASANNFDPILPRRYQRWMAAFEGENSSSQELRLNLMAVGAVEHIDSAAEYGIRFDSVPAGERARWLPCAILASDELDAWSIVSSGQIDFNRQVVLEPKSEPRQANCSENPATGSAAIVSETPNSLLVEVDAPAPGWLVLADTFYPGWLAQIDGKSADILPANSLFRAVQVESGRHLVAFIYRPVSFWVGVLASIIAWCILGIILIGARNSRLTPRNSSGTGG